MASDHEIETTAVAMKKCGVLLVHKVKVNLKDKNHEHKMRLDIFLEGTQEQVDLMKWQFAALTEKSNKWTSRILAQVAKA